MEVPKKRKRGIQIPVNEKEEVLKILNLCIKEKKLTVTAAVKQASKECNMSMNLVYGIKKEFEKGGLKLPHKKRKLTKPLKNSRIYKYNEFYISVLRTKVQELFEKNLVPTLRSLTNLMNAEKDLPKITPSTLHRVVKEMGFSCELQSIISSSDSAALLPSSEASCLSSMYDDSTSRQLSLEEEKCQGTLSIDD